jgi:hypothetical protein
MYRNVNTFKEGYEPRNNLVKMRMMICLQILTTFLREERIISADIGCV